VSAGEIPVALLAGFLSFLAPCVLPLVPGYLSAVSAVNADELGRPGTARRVVASSIPFVLGFTAVFVTLGVGASLLGGSLFRDQFLLEQIAGLVLVVFGLAFMGLLPWPEPRRRGPRPRRRSRGSRGLLGGAVAVCAAPCIGPVRRRSSSPAPPTALGGAALLASLLARARDPVSV
jgi:cytochrome c-type biogenesis protein